jgi:cysteine desulfurase
MKKIFLDNSSTTRVDDRVVKAMLPYYSEIYGNASSIHTFGREAAQALDHGRHQVAQLLNAKDKEIIFTAGGTESDNMAIKGTAYLHKQKRNSIGPHIITTTIEHPAVLETCKHLELQGFKVAYLSVDSNGLIDPEVLKNTIGPNTFLVSIMYANNEIGTIEPIKELVNIAHEKNILFHTDAVQAVIKVPIDLKKIPIDFLALSSHKIYGPKGIGALFIRNGRKIEPLIHGGGHEGGIRSTTYNIPGIIGLGTACEIARRTMHEEIRHMKKLRDTLITSLSQIEECYLNGHPTKRLVNNAHFRFTGIEGESLLLSLDDKGIAAATGSACSSKKLHASHVLTAIGLNAVESQGSIRLTVGRFNTEDEIKYVMEVFPEIVNKLRQLSPLWNP